MPIIARFASSSHVPPRSRTSCSRVEAHTCSESTSTPSMSKTMASATLSLEERHELASRNEILEELVARARIEAARRVEHLRQQRDVADGVEEDSRPPEHPVHSGVDVRLLAEGLVPRARGLLTSVPRREADRLDRL